MVTPRSLARDPRHSRLFSTDFIFRRTRDTLYSLRYVRANKSTKLLALPCSTHALANSLSHAHHALFDRPRSVIPPLHRPAFYAPIFLRPIFLQPFDLRFSIIFHPGWKEEERTNRYESIFPFLSFMVPYFFSFFYFRRNYRFERCAASGK